MRWWTTFPVVVRYYRLRVAKCHRYGRYICVKNEGCVKNMGKQAVLLNWVLSGYISVTNVKSVKKKTAIYAGIFNICSLEEAFMPI